MTWVIPYTIIGLVVVLELFKHRRQDVRRRRIASLALVLYLLGEGVFGYFVFIQPARKREAAIASGIVYPGMIVSLRQTGSFLNRNPEVELEIEVQPANRQSYRTRLVMFMPLVKLSSYEAGTHVEVFVDRRDPDNILIKGLLTP